MSYGLVFLCATLGVLGGFLVAIAPLITFISFAQTYDIVYFGFLQFGFPSGMILLTTLTVCVIAFNFGLAFRRGSDGRRTPLSQIITALGIAAYNISLYIAIAFIVKQTFHVSNQFMDFTLLMTLNMTTPILHPLFAGLGPKVIKTLEYVGITTTLSIFAKLAFIGEFPITHPFLVFALAVFVLVCFSSALGEVAALSTDLRSEGRRLGRHRVVLSIILLSCATAFTAATWYYSHAHIAVVLTENIGFDFGGKNGVVSEASTTSIRSIIANSPIESPIALAVLSVAILLVITMVVHGNRKKRPNHVSSVGYR